jgi:hypothetical protein
VGSSALAWAELQVRQASRRTEIVALREGRTGISRCLGGLG